MYNVRGHTKNLEAIWDDFRKNGRDFEYCPDEEVEPPKEGTKSNSRYIRSRIFSIPPTRVRKVSLKTYSDQKVRTITNIMVIIHFVLYSDNKAAKALRLIWRSFCWTQNYLN